MEQVLEPQILRSVSRNLLVIPAVMYAWMEVKRDVLLVQQGRSFIKGSVSLLVLRKLTLILTLVKVKIEIFGDIRALIDCSQNCEVCSSAGCSKCSIGYYLFNGLCYSNFLLKK